MGLMCNKIVSHCPIDESHLNFSGRIYCIQFFLSARNRSLLWVRFFSLSTKVRLHQSWHWFLEPPRQLRVQPLQKALLYLVMSDLRDMFLVELFPIFLEIFYGAQYYHLVVSSIKKN